jgi:hypothetical protein
MMGPIVDGGIVAGAVVLLSWVINQGLKLVGVELPEIWRKGIVFVATVALAFLQDPLDLGTPALEPAYIAGLLAQVAVLFKAAQVLYDQVFQRLLKA